MCGLLEVLDHLEREHLQNKEIADNMESSEL